MRRSLPCAGLLLFFATAGSTTAQGWSTYTCGPMAGNDVTLQLCTEGCSLAFSYAVYEPPVPGTCTLDFSWDALGGSSSAGVFISGKDGNVFSINVPGFSGSDWCGVEPCSGQAPGLVVPVTPTDRLEVWMELMDFVNCWEIELYHPGSHGILGHVSGFAFFAMPGISVVESSLDASVIGTADDVGSGSVVGGVVGLVDFLADADGDGVPDVAVGAPAEVSTQQGAIEARHGPTGALLWKHIGAVGEMLGQRFANVGDVTGDGLDDLLAGAPDAGPGHALVLSGADGQLVTTIPAISPSSLFGAGVGAAGDVDLDGVPDLLVGASKGPGRVYVISGADHVSVLTTTVGPTGSGLGVCVTGLGDLTGDGRPELLLGQKSGGARLISTANGAVLGTFPGSTKGNEPFCLARAGDLDADGVTDFAIGDVQLAPYGTTRLYSGAALGLLFELPSNGWWFGGRAGSLAALGDVDGDGHDDLAASFTPTNDGQFRILSGVDGSALLADDGLPWVGSEHVVAAGLDVSGDGLPDVAVGTPGQVRFMSGDLQHYEAPQLLADGALVADTPLLLTIAGGPPSAATLLVVGLAKQPTPWKGGVLVPRPDVVLGGVSLDGAGELTLTTRWPAGFSGVPIWVQAWMAAAAAAQGFVATDTLAFVGT